MMAPVIEDAGKRVTTAPASSAERLIITLDGPAASGKSSAAKRVAERLSVPYISSGLLYRAATYLVHKSGVDPADEAAIVRLLEEHEVELKPRRPNQLWLDDREITSALNTEAVDASVSVVARHPRVRAWVKERLRDLRGSFVIDGRDMGTVVFPQADYKFYLNAPTEVRAKRRLGERGANLAEVTEALRKRDALDASQLVPAPDAVHIDTARLSIDEVVAEVLRRVRCAS
jgi:CMP/dCMP kinase